MFPAKGSSRNHLAPQSGFTLLEALIAFLVLSIGLIGIVSLLTLSKSTQHQALQRTRAIAMANDLLERVRGNPRGIQIYASRNKSFPLGNKSIDAPPAKSCTRSHPCSGEEKALQDLWDWERTLDGHDVTASTDDGKQINTSGLISPSACVSFTPVEGKQNTGVVSIVIQWRGLTKLSRQRETPVSQCKEISSEENPYIRLIEVTTYLAGDLIMPIDINGGQG